ncbi:MAG: tail fiber domain-containing protein [Rhodoglobus sp.]
MPSAEDDQVRKLRDQERTTRENAAARTLEASQIGKGGIRVTDGGSITVEAPGTIDLSGGSFTAANVTGTSSVTSGGTIQGATVVSTGNVSAAGAVSGSTGTFHGGVKSIDVYNRLVSGSPYKVGYVDNTGQLGYVPSSRRYKRDIRTAQLDVRSVMAKLRVVTFRYLNAVEMSGKDAPTEWGVIAEEIHELGLTWLVDYNEDGKPDGVKHERFAILLIMASKEQQTQIDALAARLDALGA